MSTYSLFLKCGIALFWACLVQMPATPLHAQTASSVIGIPAPHGGELGQIGGGMAFQSRTRNTESGWLPDANVGFMVGLGDSKELLGLALGFNIFGLSNQIGEDNNFGSGTLDVQLNRAINDYIFVGAGVRSLTNWRAPEQGIPPRNNRSFYLTSNFIVPIHRRYDEPFSLLFINVGLGNGIYRLIRDFDPNNSGNFNPFGSVALQVLRGTNAIVEWNGSGLTAGFSVYPFKKMPFLGGNVALTDLTADESPRLIGAVGYFIQIGR